MPVRSGTVASMTVRGPEGLPETLDLLAKSGFVGKLYPMAALAESAPLENMHGSTRMQEDSDGQEES